MQLGQGASQQVQGLPAEEVAEGGGCQEPAEPEREGRVDRAVGKDAVPGPSKEAKRSGGIPGVMEGRRWCREVEGGRGK